LNSKLVLLPTAQRDIESLDSQTLHRLDRLFDLLTEFPYAAQVADITGYPYVRRAVCKDYLVFYSYNRQVDTVLIYTVRHGARRPPMSMSDFDK
jgi:plasmid stabilization system protein ParE